TLARIRRMSGNPHLAAHILTALGRFAPPSLLSWVRYELTLCIGPPGDLLPDAPATPIDPGALIVASPDAFARACAALRDAARNRPFAEGELGALTAMLDPSVAPTSDARAWVAGTSASPPFGLHGVSVATDNAPYGVVLAHPGRPARRVLRIAADRLGIEPRGLGKDRIDAAAATLLLAPDTGLTSTELFEAVYGFTYKPKLHSGSLRVVLHRLRGGDLPIAIERVDERIAARALEPLAVYDPRCVHSVHDSVLRYIATHPETVAKEIAANLGMPARSTQRALSSLVDEGWCARVGSGPSTAYRVEDTTFSEPTAWS
ncbi:MAG: helix-turn-helix domain-containing protein, partial [Sandaracinaceae bacterium]